ncbi:MAG: outer membrane protein transport protein [Pseudomonadota bacterium]
MTTLVTRLLSGAALMALAAGSAQAGGFAVKEGSVSSQGMSFSNYTAGANDITHIYQNPAALQKTTGSTLTVGGTISYITPSADGDFDQNATADFFGIGGGDGNPSKDAIVPGTYLGFRIHEKAAIGLSITSPFGLRTEYDESDAELATTEATETELKLIVFTPTVAAEVVKGFTVGAGLSVAYADLTFNAGGNTALPTNPQFEYRGDDIAFGVNVGALIDFTPSTTLGISYKSGFNLEAEGNFSAAALGGGTFHNSTFSADAPGLLSIGLRQNLTENLELALEAQWQNWSVLDEAVISNDAFGEIPETFGYKDAYFFAAGLQYQAFDSLQLRTGVAYDQTPTTDEDRSIRVPDEDRIWLSVGASYEIAEGMSVDAAYSYLRAIEDPTVDIDVGGTEFGTAEFEADVHIISVGGRYDF